MTFACRLVETPRFYKQAMLVRNPIEYTKHVAARFGDFVHVRGVIDFYLVNHPHLVNEVLTNKGERFVRHHPDNPAYERLRRIGRSGLATCAEARWAQQRRLLAPLFTAASTQGLAQLVLDTATTACERWERAADAQHSLQLKRETNRILLETSTRCLFGELPGQDFSRLEGWFRSLKTYLEGFPFPLIGHWKFPHPTQLRARAALLQFDRYAKGLLRSCADSSLTRGSPSSGSLLALMRHAKDPETGAALPDAVIAHELLTFLIAGYESTSSALLWTLYYLATNAAIHARVAAELSRVVGSGPVRPQHLSELHYLRRVIQEAMRISPASWFIARSTVKPQHLASVLLPADSHLLISIPAVHHHRLIWPEPACFDPDRFLPENVASRPSGAYLPFGRGRHTCIGSHLASLELVAISAVLLSRLDLRGVTSDLDATDVRAGLSVYPRRPVWVRARRAGRECSGGAGMHAAL